ncbi:polysaccharide biosynthesis/export family protein [Brevundimonas sp.]|uniref:polysaccharide biosynthesis/export family protein n=1 Tax=Brevundimonas sp. TaxID=1871086 RepID=UPI002C144F2F|nr:polysaccharide biosynthesis/export family protein [Brevundimonas sp.]HWQ88292.1 polysaccharide biosynthesis/export family protein [Brevundimonas sp.]
MRLFLLFLAAAGLAGCGTQGPASFSSAGTIDPQQFMAASSGAEASAYRIGPSDKLALTVFQVEELSFAEIFVDASGKLQLPLLGSVQAAGLTPAELSADLERRLGERYLRNPQVSVSVSEAASQKITVDGAVVKPGVYEMRGRTTLLQAVAMAEGGTRVADLKKVAVFRSVGGRPMIAVFDLAAIRRGQAPDPVVLGDDIVVVDTSRLNARYRDIIELLPGMAIFAYL